MKAKSFKSNRKMQRMWLLAEIAMVTMLTTALVMAHPSYFSRNYEGLACAFLLSGVGIVGLTFFVRLCRKTLYLEHLGHHVADDVTAIRENGPLIPLVCVAMFFASFALLGLTDPSVPIWVWYLMLQVGMIVSVFCDHRYRLDRFTRMHRKPNLAISPEQVEKEVPSHFLDDILREFDEIETVA